MKTLRRRCIIRQYDYLKLTQMYIPLYYHRAEFAPITINDLEQERLLHILKNDNSDIVQRSGKNQPVYVEDLEYPRNYLRAMQDYLYNSEYVNWFSDYDEDGYMWIQARSNTPRTVLGWGVFEYDYERNRKHR